MRSALREPELDEVWRAAATAARDALEAVERGELQASGRQQEDWRQTLARAQSWGLA